MDIHRCHPRRYKPRGKLNGSFCPHIIQWLMLIVCRCIKCQTNEAIFRIRKGEVLTIKGMTPMQRVRGIMRFLNCSLLARNRGVNLNFYLRDTTDGFVCVVLTLGCDLLEVFSFSLCFIKTVFTSTVPQ